MNATLTIGGCSKLLVPRSPKAWDVRVPRGVLCSRSGTAHFERVRNLGVLQSSMYMWLARIFSAVRTVLDDKNPMSQSPTFSELFLESESLGLTIDQYLLLLGLIYQMPFHRREEIFSDFSLLVFPKGEVGVRFISALTKNTLVDERFQIRLVWWEKVASYPVLNQAWLSEKLIQDYPLIAMVLAPRLNQIWTDLQD